MNSASQDFPWHLGVWRERMLHPTDYQKAVHYFTGGLPDPKLN